MSDKIKVWPLTLRIIQARNLLAKDSNGLSDPYVELHMPLNLLTEGRNKELFYDGLKFKGNPKTQVIKKNLNPQWNESFKLSIGTAQDEIILQVLDWNLVMKNENISFVKFTVGSFDLDADKECTKWLQLAANAGELEVGITPEGWEFFAGEFQSTKDDDKKKKESIPSTSGGEAEDDNKNTKTVAATPALIDPNAKKVWVPSEEDRFGITAKAQNYTEISPEISKLTTVTYGVDFAENLLKSIPVELTTLACVSLFLSSNQLESLPKEIGTMAKLEDLVLDKNKLKSLPDEIGKLKKLKTLRVDSNELEALPSTIGGLISLTALHAENNKLTVIPNEIGNLKRLEWLSLNNNPIKRLCKGLSQTRPMKYLYIDIAKLEWPPKDVLQAATANGRLECEKNKSLQSWISEHANEA